MKEFLEGSTQTQIFLQSSQLRKELDTSVQQQSVLVQQLLEMLIQYENISKYYPKDQYCLHRLFKIPEWIKIALKNKSKEASIEVVNQYSINFGESCVRPLQEHVIGYVFNLQQKINESNYKMRKIYDLQVHERLQLGEKTYENLKFTFEEQFMAQKEKFSDFVDPLIMTQVQNISKRLFDLEKIAQNDDVENKLWRFEDLVTTSKLLKDVSIIAFDFKTTNNSNNDLLLNGFDSMRNSCDFYQDHKKVNLEFQVRFHSFK